MATAKSTTVKRPKAVKRATNRDSSPVSLADVIAHVVAKIPELGADRSSALLARVFYRQMRRQGCSDRQMIRVASEIIGCLNRSLKRLEERQSS